MTASLCFQLLADVLRNNSPGLDNENRTKRQNDKRTLDRRLEILDTLTGKRANTYWRDWHMHESTGKSQRSFSKSTNAASEEKSEDDKKQHTVFSNSSNQTDGP